ncbi:MAG: hypothetical protein E7411_05290 [Ruminococcaceae bacterium]|nr:hypothetical protein [Oscillospiraceae bacterium]
MNFKRAKTILIVIFLFVNIFLIVINNLFYESDITVDTKTVISILSKSGISLNEDILKEYPVSVPRVEVENVAADENKLATLLLGKGYNSSKEHYYSGEGAALTVSELSVDYKVVEPKDKSFKDISPLNAGNKALKKLNKKGIGESALEVENISDNGNNNYYVTLSYKFEEYPLFNNHLYVTVTDRGILAMKGTVIDFNEIKNEDYKIIPAANILLELPSNPDLKNVDKNPEVTGIRLGYFLPMGKGEASIYAIPAYEIEISNKKIYYYDARENISSDVILLGSINAIK